MTPAVPSAASATPVAVSAAVALALALVVRLVLRLAGQVVAVEWAAAIDDWNIDFKKAALKRTCKSVLERIEDVIARHGDDQRGQYRSRSHSIDEDHFFCK